MFVDEYKQKNIPLVDTWGDLSVNELYLVRKDMIDRQEAFIRNPSIWNQIQQRINLLNELISSKLK